MLAEVGMPLFNRNRDWLTRNVATLPAGHIVRRVREWREPDCAIVAALLETQDVRHAVGVWFLKGSTPTAVGVYRIEMFWSPSRAFLDRLFLAFDQRSDLVNLFINELADELPDDWKP